MVLSQNARKFKGKLVIRPSKESVQSFKNKIKKIINEKPWNTCTCPDTNTEPRNQGVVELSQRHLLEACFHKIGNIHPVAAQAMG